jgi:signal recognition particle receptor subunit beta
MAELSRERTEVNARILYWGAEGSGKTENLRHVHRRLRADHRGPLRAVPTPLDPSLSYELLPIALGEISGVQVRLHVVAVPGSPEQAPTRTQLLDRVDGIVLVVDSRPERIDANLESFEELRASLAAYGRSLSDVAIVVQYNHRDRADELTLEALHRKLDLRGAPVFEAVAAQGKGVLQTLTTISKRVMRRLREEGVEGLPTARSEAPAPRARAIEEGLAVEARDPGLAAAAAETTDAAARVLDASWADVAAEVAVLSEPELELAELAPQPAAGLTLDSVGAPQRTGPASFQLPVVLRDTQGRRVAVSVSVRLDPGSEPEGP